MLQSREQVGKLDRKITIQKPIFEANEVGNQVVTGWENLASSPTPWANVIEGYGNEELQAQQIVGIKASTFTIRYRTDVSTEHRILHRDEVYNIRTMLEIGRKGYLKIVADSGGQYTG